MTRVAVVVPCHDDGETLPETLASLAEQEPHELVVVDDGSTDVATLALLDRLAREGTRVVHQENAGLGAARMTGVAATSAPFVMPLDADDVLPPQTLERLADALDADPEAAVAWGDLEIFGELEAVLEAGRTLDPWHITYLNTIPGTSMVRRSALAQTDGWQLRHGYEDWDLWMSFAERGLHGVHVPVVALRYRRRGGRMLSGTMQRHAEIYEHMRRRHPQLFAQRRRAWLRSRASLRARLLFPLIGAAPVSEYDRSRLYQLVDRPGQFLRMRRLRRAALR